MATQESVSRIVVMGVTGSGKSTFINLVSGSSLSVSDGLRSCTSEVLESKPFTLDDENAILVDTPGFNDTSRPDIDITIAISTYFANMHKRGVKLAGVIYMHRISDIRIGGTSLLNFRIFCELCGNKSLPNALIVTTMWSNVDPELGERREQELATAEDMFKPALDNGARLVRHDGTLERAQDVLRLLVTKRSPTLRIQRELVDEGKEFVDTAVGAELSRSFLAQAGRLKERCKKLRKQTDDAWLAQDREGWAALQRELDEVQIEQRRVDDENKRLQTATLSVIDTDIVLVQTALAERLGGRPYFDGSWQAGLHIWGQPTTMLQERLDELQKAKKNIRNERLKDEAHAISEVLQRLQSRSIEMYSELRAASRFDAPARQDEIDLTQRVNQTLEEMQGMRREIDVAIESQARLMTEVKRQQEASGRNLCDRMLAWFLDPFH